MPGTKSKNPSPLNWGSLLEFNLSKLNRFKSGVSLMFKPLAFGVGNGSPSTGVIKFNGEDAL